MAGRGLTEIQSATLEAIVTFSELHGYPPSLYDLARILGVSRTAIVDRLDALETKGAIRRTPGVHRSLAVIDQDQGD